MSEQDSESEERERAVWAFAAERGFAELASVQMRDWRTFRDERQSLIARGLKSLEEGRATVWDEATAERMREKLSSS